MRNAGMAFPLQGFRDRFRSFWIHRSIRFGLSGFISISGAGSSLLGDFTFGWRGQVNSGSSCFRQANCDGLLCRSHANSPGASIVDGLLDEFSGLGGGRFAFLGVLLSLPNCSFLSHRCGPYHEILHARKIEEIEKDFRASS